MIIDIYIIIRRYIKSVVKCTIRCTDSGFLSGSGESTAGFDFAIVVERGIYKHYNQAVTTKAGLAKWRSKKKA